MVNNHHLYNYGLWSYWAVLNVAGVIIGKAKRLLLMILSKNNRIKSCFMHEVKKRTMFTSMENGSTKNLDLMGSKNLAKTNYYYMMICLMHFPK